MVCVGEVFVVVCVDVIILLCVPLHMFKDSSLLNINSISFPF